MANLNLGSIVLKKDYLDFTYFGCLGINYFEKAMSNYYLD